MNWGLSLYVMYGDLLNDRDNNNAGLPPKFWGRMAIMEETPKKITFSACIKNAKSNTKGFKAYKRELLIALVSGFVAYFWLPETEAMSEWQGIAIVVVASVVIVPFLEFAWNLAAAPIRLMNENLMSIDGRLKRLSRADISVEPIEPPPPPDYSVWGRLGSIRIKQAAMLIAGLDPSAGKRTSASAGYQTLLIEATQKGRLGRPSKTPEEWQDALDYAEVNKADVWSDVDVLTKITMSSLLTYLEREKMASDFVEKVNPYVER